MTYMGGSAPAMAQQVSDGYTLITAVQLKRLADNEMEQLAFELEKILRDQRGQVIAVDDQAALQARNRKLTRITSALSQIQATLSKRRRGH